MLAGVSVACCGKYYALRLRLFCLPSAMTLARPPSMFMAPSVVLSILFLALPRLRYYIWPLLLM